MSKGNGHDTREAWLRAATQLLRPYFEKVGFLLPEKIRFAIAFTSSGRKGNRLGECWHPSTSDDGSFEIIIRADQYEPLEVLGVLMHELAHAALPPEAGHGKVYRDAALQLGLEGPMRHAMPGKRLLDDILVPLLAALGPLPHAKLHIDRKPNGAADVPKKQKTRLLKASCGHEGCPYNVRVVAACVAIGPPHCPLHGAMTVDAPAGAAGNEAED